MEFVKLTEQLVKALVKNPDMVTIKEFETSENNFHHIQVLVDNDDMGVLIGKEGKTAKAIRTIVQASAYINGNKKVKIDIDSF
ncbi:MAG: KH domain-containing protein [Bacilli bacterium]|nr:KH domain-containing protein [Bacilli bacterium]